MAGSNSSNKSSDSGKLLFPRRNRRSHLRYLAGYAMGNYSGSESESGDDDSEIGQRAATGSLEVQTALGGDSHQNLARGDAQYSTDRAGDSGGSSKLLVADGDGRILECERNLDGQMFDGGNVRNPARDVLPYVGSHMADIVLPEGVSSQSEFEAVERGSSDFRTAVAGAGSQSSSEADDDAKSSVGNGEPELVNFCHGSYEEVGKSLAVLAAEADWRESYRLAGDDKLISKKDGAPFVIKNCLDLYTLVKASDGRRPTDDVHDRARNETGLAVANSSLFRAIIHGEVPELPEYCNGDLSKLVLEKPNHITKTSRTVRDWMPYFQRDLCVALRFLGVQINQDKAGARRVVRDARRMTKQGMTRKARNRPLQSATINSTTTGTSTAVYTPQTATDVYAKTVDGSEAELGGAADADGTVAAHKGHNKSKSLFAGSTLTGPGKKSSVYLLDQSSLTHKDHGLCAIRPLEGIVQADMRTPVLFDLMTAPQGQEFSDGREKYRRNRAPLFAARREMLTFRGKVEAVRPCHCAWKIADVDRGLHTIPEGSTLSSWEWTPAAPGDRVLLVASSGLKLPKHFQAPICPESESINTTGAADYSFGHRQAEEISSSSTFGGQIAVVWRVQGLPTWEEANDASLDASHSVQVQSEYYDSLISKLRKTNRAEMRRNRYHFEDVFPAEECHAEELYLALVLGFASFGRASYASQAQPAGQRPPSWLPQEKKRRGSTKPSMNQPWSPLKAGDVAVLVRRDKLCHSECPCRKGSYQNLGTDYCLVIYRIFMDEVGPRRLFYLVPDLQAVVVHLGSLLSEMDRKPCDEDEMKALNMRRSSCVYGSELNSRLDSSKVLLFPLEDDENAHYAPHATVRVVRVETNIEETQSADAKNWSRNMHRDENVDSRCDNPRPHMGRLGKKWDFVRYLLSDFILFFDGFHSQKNCEDSKEGIYALPLLLCGDKRNSSASVRVLSLTPAGSDLREVLHLILQEFAYFSRVGIRCVGADGKVYLVFPSVVLVLADSPAMSQAIDTLHHQANSFCTVCNVYLGSEAGLGIRNTGYTGEAARRRTHARCMDQIHGGMLCTSSRSMTANKDIRTVLLNVESEAAKSALARQGMQVLTHTPEVHSSADLTSPRKEEDPEKFVANMLPFHEYSRVLEKNWRDDAVPRDDSGRPVHDSCFHPYRSIVPGIEHLMANLIGDVMNCAMKLITKADRIAVNVYFRYLSEKIGVPAQTAFVNIADRCLYSMSMTNSHTVLFIGGRALSAVFSSRGRSERYASYDDVVPPVIELVDKLSEIVSLVWLDEDLAYEKYRGTLNHELKQKYRSLISGMKAVCSDPEQVVPEIQYGSGRSDSSVQKSAAEMFGKTKARKGSKKRKKKEVSKEETTAKTDKKSPDTASSICRASLDHSSPHKGLEMFENYLDQLGNLTVCAELAFENVHQPLKFAIAKHLSKNPHIAALIAINGQEWLGRLSLSIEAGLRGEDGSVLSLIRLLRGDAAYNSALASGITDDIRREINNLVGFDEFVPAFLRKNGRNIVSGPLLEAYTANSPVFELWKVSLRASGLQSFPLQTLDDVQDSGLASAICRAESLTRKKPDFTFQSISCLDRENKFKSPLSQSRYGETGARAHRISIGSIVRTNRSRLSTDSGSTQNETLASDGSAEYPNRPQFEPSDTFWCVIGIYFPCTNQEKSKLTGGTSGKLGTCAEPNLRLVLSPCVYSDDKTSPTLGSMNYGRSLRVMESAQHCDVSNIFGTVGSDMVVTAPRSSKQVLSLSPWKGPAAFEIMLHPSADKNLVEVVADFPRCEDVKNELYCQVVKSNSPNPIHGERELKHSPHCGPLRGGSFYVRDRMSGYPTKHS